MGARDSPTTDKLEVVSVELTKPCGYDPDTVIDSLPFLFPVIIALPEIMFAALRHIISPNRNNPEECGSSSALDKSSRTVVGLNEEGEVVSLSVYPSLT